MRKNQLFLPINLERIIEIDASVRMLDEICSELDYTNLNKAYGRKVPKGSETPAVMFEILVYNSIFDGRNSFSKTDTDATFMHMKEDHMRNGQLKAGYNVQIGVDSEYIVNLGIFSDRADQLTLIPFLEDTECKTNIKYTENVTTEMLFLCFVIHKNKKNN